MQVTRAPSWHKSVVKGRLKVCIVIPPLASGPWPSVSDFPDCCDSVRQLPASRCHSPLPLLAQSQWHKPARHDSRFFRRQPPYRSRIRVSWWRGAAFTSQRQSAYRRRFWRHPNPRRLARQRQAALSARCISLRNRSRVGYVTPFVHLCGRRVRSLEAQRLPIAAAKASSLLITLQSGATRFADDPKAVGAALDAATAVLRSVAKATGHPPASSLLPGDGDNLCRLVGIASDALRWSCAGHSSEPGEGAAASGSAGAADLSVRRFWPGTPTGNALAALQFLVRALGLREGSEPLINAALAAGCVPAVVEASRRHTRGPGGVRITAWAASVIRLLADPFPRKSGEGAALPAACAPIHEKLVAAGVMGMLAETLEAHSAAANQACAAAAAILSWQRPVPGAAAAAAAAGLLEAACGALIAKPQSEAMFKPCYNIAEALCGTSGGLEAVGALAEAVLLHLPVTGQGISSAHHLITTLGGLMIEAKLAHAASNIAGLFQALVGCLREELRVGAMVRPMAAFATTLVLCLTQMVIRGEYHTRIAAASASVGAVETIVGAMQAWPLEAVLQGWACAALQHLTNASPSGRESALAAGAVAALTAAKALEPENAGLCRRVDSTVARLRLAQEVAADQARPRRGQDNPSAPQSSKLKRDCCFICNGSCRVSQGQRQLTGVNTRLSSQAAHLRAYVERMTALRNRLMPDISPTELNSHVAKAWAGLEPFPPIRTPEYFSATAAAFRTISAALRRVPRPDFGGESYANVRNLADSALELLRAGEEEEEASGSRTGGGRGAAQGAAEDANEVEEEEGEEEESPAACAVHFLRVFDIPECRAAALAAGLVPLALATLRRHSADYSLHVRVWQLVAALLVSDLEEDTEAGAARQWEQGVSQGVLGMLAATLRDPRAPLAAVTHAAWLVAHFLPRNARAHLVAPEEESLLLEASFVALEHHPAEMPLVQTCYSFACMLGAGSAPRLSAAAVCSIARALTKPAPPHLSEEWATSFQAACARALSFIYSSESLTRAVASEVPGLFDALIAQLERPGPQHADEAGVLFSLRCLASLSGVGEAWTAPARAVRAVPAVVRVMKDHCSRVDVQSEGCFILSQLVFTAPVCARGEVLLVMIDPAVGVVSAAVTAFPLVTRIQHYGREVLDAHKELSGAVAAAEIGSSGGGSSPAGARPLRGGRAGSRRTPAPVRAPASAAEAAQAQARADAAMAALLAEEETEAAAAAAASKTAGSGAKKQAGGGSRRSRQRESAARGGGTSSSAAAAEADSAPRSVLPPLTAAAQGVEADCPPIPPTLPQPSGTADPPRAAADSATSVPALQRGSAGVRVMSGRPGAAADDAIPSLGEERGGHGAARESVSVQQQGRAVTPATSFRLSPRVQWSPQPPHLQRECRRRRTCFRLEWLR